MNSFQKWINNLLINWGIIDESKTIWDNVIILALILLAAVAINYICKYTIVNAFKQIAKKTSNRWDDLIVERKIIDKAVNIIPAIFIYLVLPIAYNEEYAGLNSFMMRLCIVYIIAISIRFINSIVSLTYEFSVQKSVRKNKPLKGFVQVIQIVVIFIGVILIIAVIVDKSPGKLLAGLGASAAILSLVFKDTLMGFVAGIQLTANDMVRVGDWIQMPKHGADGFVIEVTLNTVKVQNWDKTIVTIPPYALVSDSFQNWRGMFDSGGRRIKRSIFIDMNSIRFCTPEMLSTFRKISIITEYIDNKETELKKHNEEHQINSSVLVNGRRQTNIGVFRAYIEQYLKNNPNVNHDMMCMVRQLQPTAQGLPLELYLFTSDTRWVYHEAAMADIFDHILASIHQFDLRVFQEISGADLLVLKN